MPAIQLAELRKRAAHLAELFPEPQRFVRELNDFLDHYANRTHRPGQAGEPPPLMAAFNVPRPVMRHIGIELSPLAAQHADTALEVCRALWEQPYLEHRQLAAVLLGQIPPRPPETILDTLEAWTTPLPEDHILEAVVRDGLLAMRIQAHAQLVSRIDDWLSQQGREKQRLGLRALSALIDDLAQDEAPRYFRLLTPFVRKSPLYHKTDVEDILAKLAQRTASETAYFLRQNLDAPDNPDVAWFARRTAPHLPPEYRAYLKTALRNA